ncbi:hypothetical protein NM688_g5638 [Phlebia brevispora]|uniref:Uncharacterized protein n=1 Tax=Phlebia brevispora TaxID=194682 RepID=A0ACC1SS79_9APHY|nr:hypothetical protein NM688_g5638 [Phlebia brevispora]
MFPRLPRPLALLDVTPPSAGQSHFSRAHPGSIVFFVISQLHAHHAPGISYKTASIEDFSSLTIKLLASANLCHLAQITMVLLLKCYTRPNDRRVHLSPRHRGAFTRASPSRLTITRTQKPKPIPAPSSLVFGHTFTDHMINIPWTAQSGWGSPEIKPYAPLSIEPSATVFHYAQGLFEGLKAYRDANGRITLFRPDMNMRRMNASAARIALPTFNGDALVELIKRLIRLDKHWIPDQEGYSLYVRPAMIGTEAALGIHPPSEAMLFVICSPVGPYYPDGFKPVALYGTTEYTRAAPGGIGAYKLSANYAPGVMVQKEAAKKGYVQNLWLFGPEHNITEVGTMNAFMVFKQPDGSMFYRVALPHVGRLIPFRSS